MGGAPSRNAKIARHRPNCPASKKSKESLSGLVPTAATPREVTGKGPKSRKPIFGVHVMLDHIKRKIIKSAEAPDGNGQQQSDLERRLFQHQQKGRHQADG